MIFLMYGSISPFLLDRHILWLSHRKSLIMHEIFSRRNLYSSSVAKPEGTPGRVVPAERRGETIMKIFYYILAFAMLLCLSGEVSAQTTDESALFSSYAPDAMIVLDLSGSMRWNPRGDSDLIYGNATCSGTTFYDDSNHSGYTTLCTRYAIARRSIFSILDDDGNGKINADDEVSLNIRFGLGKFQGSDYSKIRDIKSKYSKIYCGSTTYVRSTRMRLEPIISAIGPYGIMSRERHRL